ncbi:phage tail protein [Clostridium botulinum]|nr:phage tail protein [Clostridium botulinum]MBY6813260.1 phage tail protein [Clostridium botulinum]MBY6821563.1 phage tail protein [Clostridium botulinum]NFI57237.1 phage tail protein [Clostridium botulinum]NFJ49874.1 phage tail protein [Clostridium botulinum]
MDIYTLVTNIGKAKIANATVTGSKVDFLKLKVGDGNGSYYEPSESQTDLVHTVWEGNVNNVLTGGENNPNWIIVQTVIPPGEGGFYVREAGIFDNDDNLLAISKYPESYKPSMEDGSTDDLTIELIFEVSNASIINLKIDPLVTTASMKDLNNLEAKINTQLKDIAKKTDKFTEDSNGKLLYNNNKVGATKAKELELETIPGMNAKDVQAGIAEVFQGANNFISYKQGIAGVVGSPVTGTQNKNETVNSIQGIKNNAASALKAKNIDASGNEALASLVSKIANISIQGMGGKKFLGGVINHTNGTRDEIFLNFNAGAITIDQPNSSYSQYPYVCVTKVGGSFYPFQSSNSVSGIYYDSTKKILSISSSVSTGNFPFNAWGE